MINILEAQALGNNILSIKFEGGDTFLVDMKPFIKSGVSSALKDDQFLEW